MAFAGLTWKFNSSKSRSDLSALQKELQKDWPTDAESYEILEDCGRGVSATVHKVLCTPRNEIVAVKKMDLESFTCSLDVIVQETQTMRNYNHPNVLPLYTSFVHNTQLWMVMPLIGGGSVLHIMKYKHPDGLDEVSIATIMRDVLKALDYVHRQGGIHRDIKAGNILVDRDGCVYLADFGVSSSLERGGSWGDQKQSRMTFVGTPCWMAPEVMELTSGYDHTADIWSFGITLLEMAHGHAPFAKFPPMKVLMMTLQSPPPTLNDKDKRAFSKAMRDLVAQCLQKDPSKRPTAAKLLEHKFFKMAKDEDYLAKHLLADLPSLGDSVKDINAGRAATREVENDANEALCAEEYKKGVSSWNFDVGALKAQAELEPDIPGLAMIPESDDKEFSLQAAKSSGGGAPATAPMTTAEPNVLTLPVQGTDLSAPTTEVPLLPPISNAATAGANALPLMQLSSVFSEPTISPSDGVLSPTGAGNTSGGGSTRKGRFQIYSTGDEPPPLHAQQRVASETGAALPKEADGHASMPFLATSRAQSEDVSKREELGGNRSDGQPSAMLPTTASLGNLSTASSAEPKKKGRFMIIEDTSSGEPALGGARVSETGAGSRDGQSRMAPALLPGQIMIPLNVIIPKLNQVLESVSLQQEAVQKLLLSVTDNQHIHTSCLPGRKSRRMSTSTTSDNDSPPGGGIEESSNHQPKPPGCAVSYEGLDAEALRSRLAHATAENCSLKLRIHLLESLLGQEHGSKLGVEQDAHQSFHHIPNTQQTGHPYLSAA